jgi:transposase
MSGEVKPRRKYDREFKIQAVKLALESEKTTKKIAEDLGIHSGILTRWKREYKEDVENAFPGMGKLKPEDEELRRLKKENEDLKQEREILKKALAIFSRPQR